MKLTKQEKELINHCDCIIEATEDVERKRNNNDSKIGLEGFLSAKEEQRQATKAIMEWFRKL